MGLCLRQKSTNVLKINPECPGRKCLISQVFSTYKLIPGLSEMKTDYFPGGVVSQQFQSTAGSSGGWDYSTRGIEASLLKDAPEHVRCLKGCFAGRVHLKMPFVHLEAVRSQVQERILKSLGLGKDSNVVMSSC